MASKKNHMGLFFKFTSIISVFLIIVFVFIGYVIIKYQENSLLEERDKNAQKLTDMIAKISAFHIERYSYYSLDKNTIDLQSAPDNDILSVQIFDTNHKKLNPSGIDPSRIKVSRAYRLRKQSDCIYKSDYGELKTVGSVEIIFSLESIYLNIAETRFTFICIVVSAIVILFLINILAFRFLINNPIKSLAESADRISKGDFDIEITDLKDDEIGHLGERFMEMSYALNNSFLEIHKQKQEIEEYNRNLEEMVRTRTAELNNALSKQFKLNDEMLETARKLDIAYAQLKKKNQQLLNEMEMARRVQLGIIPNAETYPKRKEFSVASRYICVNSVGGDLYDVIPISENIYGFLMVDVSGHGVSSALVSTMAKVSFNSNSRSGLSTAEICQKVNTEMNNLIGDILISDVGVYYMTVFFGILDLENGTFEFTNAGHLPGLLHRDNTNEIVFLKHRGPVMGPFPEVIYKSDVISLSPGDKIVLFTDGIIEARNDKDEFFEFDRLLEFYKKYHDMPVEEFIEALLCELNLFCGNREADDDRSILMFEFQSRVLQESLEETLC